MSDSKPEDTANAPHKKRAVDLLTPEQLKRKREGDKTAQRLRRERLKAQVEALQDQIAQLQAQNYLLEERLLELTALNNSSTCSECISGEDRFSRQAAASSNLLSQDVWPEERGDPSPHSQEDSMDNAFWVSSLTTSTATATATTPTITTPPESLTWADDYTKPSIYQMLNENPRGFGFTVWSEPCFISDSGPGGLPTEYAAAIESTSNRRRQRQSTNKAGEIDSNDHRQYAVSAIANEGNIQGRPSDIAGKMAVSSGNGALKSHPVQTQLIPGNQVWTALPKHSAPSCLIDRVVIDLISQRRLQDNASEFHGHPFPSVQSLLNPCLGSQVNRYPVTSSIVNNIIPVTTVPTLPEQIAILYVMSAVIRWQIQPTEAHYDAMPIWLRPCAAQLAVPHAPWVDFVSWPLLRERMCRWSKYHDQHYLISSICNESLSINWPYRDEDIVLYFNGEGAVLNPVFDLHISNINNWTVGNRMLTVFPEFKGEINIK